MKRTGRAALAVVGGVLMLAGAALLVANAVEPEAVERAYGAAKVTVQREASRVTEEVFDAPPPVVRLEDTGGAAELDAACFGGRGFVVMTSYEADGVPPVAAAHNNCGGDVVLSWDEGQQVQIEGQGFDGLYEVVELRYTPKVWATTDDLRGLAGDLALQTCHYGEDRMRFAGLALVD